MIPPPNNPKVKLLTLERSVHYSGFESIQISFLENLLIILKEQKQKQKQKQEIDSLKQKVSDLEQSK